MSHVEQPGERPDGGKIVQVGGLSGYGSTPNLARLQVQNADIVGISAGSVEHFKAMSRFVERRSIRPIVSHVLTFSEAGKSYDILRCNDHFGKVVLTID